MEPAPKENAKTMMLRFTVLALVLVTGAVAYWCHALHVRVMIHETRIETLSSSCITNNVRAGGDPYAPPAICWLSAELNSELAVMPADPNMWVRCAPIATNILEVQVHAKSGADSELVHLELRQTRAWAEDRARSRNWQSWLRVIDRIYRD